MKMGNKSLDENEHERWIWEERRKIEIKVPFRFYHHENRLISKLINDSNEVVGILCEFDVRLNLLTSIERFRFAHHPFHLTQTTTNGTTPLPFLGCVFLSLYLTAVRFHLLIPLTHQMKWIPFELPFILLSLSVYIYIIFVIVIIYFAWSTAILIHNSEYPSNSFPFIHVLLTLYPSLCHTYRVYHLILILSSIYIHNCSLVPNFPTTFLFSASNRQIKIKKIKSNYASQCVCVCVHRKVRIEWCLVEDNGEYTRNIFSSLYVKVISSEKRKWNRKWT